MEPPLSSRLPEVSAVAYSRLLSPSRSSHNTNRSSRLLPPPNALRRVFPPFRRSRRWRGGVASFSFSAAARSCLAPPRLLPKSGKLRDTPLLPRASAPASSSYVVLGFLVIELDYSSVYAKASWKNLVSYGVVEFTSTAVFRFLSLLRLSLPLACSSAIE
ncbi:hypothetical protein SASPL_140777 [Salvia splendens]|uniref:Uncharacterized protein n=1 Tax=Salvia splendens TaxID=180675 RepID=A0A8X8WSU6_SALSN|nr:hypothetical protein SASPL_140777 [Salvia splendens]